MEAMLQRHCARYIYVIPEGLRELMSDISREVLRSQPQDFYTFIADYLDALMITRENARVAARLVQSLTEMATTTAIFLEETGMPRDEVDVIVKAVQTAFRKSIDSNDTWDGEVDEETHVVAEILSEIQVSPEQQEIAATVIQQAFRRFKERKEREKQLLAGMVDWRVAARSAIRLYRKTGVTNEEANRAATLIKAAYKGYYTRKLMKKIAAFQHDDDFLRYSLEAQDYLLAQADADFYEEEGEERGSLMDDDKIKSVTIDYNTVKPHVAFDTSSSQLVTSERLSTVSSIARYSVKWIFDKALGEVESRFGPTISEEVISDVGGNEEEEGGL